MTFNKEYLEELKKVSFWVKFYAVLIYIGAGFVIFFGLISLMISVFIGLVYLAFGALSIFMGNYLLKGANSVKEITTETPSEKSIENLVEGHKSLKFYFQINVILNLVMIGLVVVFMVAMIFAGDAILDAFEPYLETQTEIE